MIVFLSQHKNNSSNSELIESHFSYAIYDYLTCKKETNEYTEIAIKHKKLIQKLETIASESISLNGRKTTTKFIHQLMQGKHKKFYRELQPFLLPFIYDKDD